ncbi:unnamed protein product [Acanthoscelides obtectus]|uniref:Uncharacterized protein n=1 Tax=Acanthoscelides obtectus TaxID=200917 RepID=A0A9P0NXV7_ACAOB|nr:unnamed protein product [Acanthoscelides obtectus]CAK1640741.1 hypothetical protein AOBTE_LOCUS11904 [Acanthoscelides obtectus]
MAVNPVFVNVDLNFRHSFENVLVRLNCFGWLDGTRSPDHQTGSDADLISDSIFLLFSHFFLRRGKPSL